MNKVGYKEEAVEYFSYMPLSSPLLLSSSAYSCTIPRLPAILWTPPRAYFLVCRQANAKKAFPNSLQNEAFCEQTAEWRSRSVTRSLRSEVYHRTKQLENLCSHDEGCSKQLYCVTEVCLQCLHLCQCCCLCST